MQYDRLALHHNLPLAFHARAQLKPIFAQILLHLDLAHQALPYSGFPHHF